MTVIDEPPLLAAGERIIIRLVPADGSTARWEYALTPNRKPYGGTVASAGDTPQRGALVFSTVFEQDVDFRRMANHTWDRIRDHALEDAVFLIFWIGGLALTVGAGVWRWRAAEGD